MGHGFNFRTAGKNKISFIIKSFISIVMKNITKFETMPSNIMNFFKAINDEYVHLSR